MEDYGDATTSEPPDEISSRNTLFGKYQVGKLLGRGAFAKVYHARNVQSGENVAIKCISKQKIVKAKGRLSEDMSRRYFQQLISAVGYCHSHGVFHRDLKPENLLLDESGNLKVSDFGLSAVTEQVRNDGLLHTLCGTPAYVAPEILAKRGYDGPKVDIWSCGIILYVLNAGYLPFNNPNLMVMYRKIYKGDFRCPRWMSPDLKRFLSRLLDPNSETRITINEILRDPWFNKGCHKESEESFGYISEKEDGKDTFLNAFDLISFSSGFDLSGLFSDSRDSVDDERFVSAETPENIIEKIEEMGKQENVTVLRNEWHLVFEGQNGNLVVEIEVYRLTESLVVVEIRSYEGMWGKKLSSLIDQSYSSEPESSVSSELDDDWCDDGEKDLST
ncbi:hypothetical protein IFM89_002737 [Coptis chinensis]|uniref:non-specific serine/threonine protein kinase n=1 Tax=Coptis chinensis TaxID=261450 RepID=A0A835IKI5_9MAGN|nr:hypothetical protein IFM89_002737 [Coptis chinensis]